MEITKRDITRRKFLVGAGCFTLAGTLGLCAEHEMMIPVKIRDGEIPCDFHAHPNNFEDYREETETILRSPGLIGLGHNNVTTRNLTYEQVLKKYNGIQEIIPGQLAMIGEGFAYRTQEIETDPFEILAMDFNGPYFDDGGSTIDKIKEIHDRDGMAMVVHPFVEKGGLLGYRVVECHEELLNIIDGERPDAIEEHNGQLKWWLNGANELAVDFCYDTGLPGLHSSDAKRVIEQVKLCFVGINKEYISEGRIKEVIQEKKFTKYNSPTVSALSLIEGYYQQLFGE